ncbi:MAG: hypothetical protein U0996_17845 [Planctomycetaceae bacterium]
MRGQRFVAFAVISVLCRLEPLNADDYQILAESVATPLYHNFAASEGAFADSQAMLRTEIALQRIKFLSDTDNGIADVRSSVVAALEACHSTYEDIRSLDSHSPDYAGIATKAIQASPAMYRAANRALSEPQELNEMEEEPSDQDKEEKGDMPQEETDSMEGEEAMDEQRRLEEEELRRRQESAQPEYEPSDTEMSEEDQEDIEALREALQELVMSGFNAHELSTKRDEYRTQYRDVRSKSLELREVAERRYQSSREYLYGIGIAVKFSDGKAIISEVIENSEASKHDISFGDELLSIDGVSCPEGGSLAIPNETDDVLGSLLLNAMHTLDTGDKMTSERREWLERLRGEYDSEVQISVLRGGDQIIVSKVARGDHECDKPNFHVDYTGSWHATYSSDEAWLRNDSGRDLTDVTIFVTLEGVHGPERTEAADKHMHYLSKWPNGETRLARYASSSLSGIISNEAVDTVEKIHLEVYAKELQSKLDFYYANTKAIDDDLEQLWTSDSRPQITASYAADNIFGNAASYLYLDGGLNSMPTPTATVTLTEGERTETETFYPNSTVWRSGNFNCLKFQSESFNSMDPDSMTVDLSFPDTNYRPTLKFTFKGE